MIKLITITDSFVTWSDTEDTYTYPRCMFPSTLTLDDKIEYLAGEFNYTEEDQWNA